MSDPLGTIAIILAILLFVAIASAVVLIPISRRAKRVETEAETETEGQVDDATTRSATVNGLGLESLGRAQVRGNGTLVLTPEALTFRQWVPQRETTIPLAAITSVGTEKTWLGKWVGSALLCVRWRTPDGGEDAMAWQVRDLDGWLAAIQSAAER
jgi:hypothetical protein